MRAVVWCEARRDVRGDLLAAQANMVICGFVLLAVVREAGRQVKNATNTFV
jgi:hypothetical protein